MNSLKATTFQGFLAFLIVAGFFSLTYIPVFYNGFTVSAALEQTVVNAFMLVVGYFFGSSKSSQTKDETIQAQAVQQTREVEVTNKEPIEVKEVK